MLYVGVEVLFSLGRSGISLSLPTGCEMGMKNPAGAKVWKQNTHVKPQQASAVCVCVCSRLWSVRAPTSVWIAPGVRGTILTGVRANSPSVPALSSGSRKLSKLCSSV